jgi:hypothetical protein
MRIFFFVLLLFGTALHAQFAPAAGMPGSTALRHDSSCFVAWAKGCSIQRGLMDISQPDTGYASVGDSLSALGNAFQNGVVSLGDGGFATLRFDPSIANGNGWDFAVFENTFLDSFLELAFVEVSTDGKKFVRFQSESLSDTSKQTVSFGFTKPENVNNLAGKYRAGFGTPFDLEALKDSAGIDVQNIWFVRVVDVVGSINNAYATRDSKGRKINDPWPTRFPSSGFDLDAVGVIHRNISASRNDQNKIPFATIWPNPYSSGVLNIRVQTSAIISICNLQGQIVGTYALLAGNNQVTPDLGNGSYFLLSEHHRKPTILTIHR